MRHIIPVADAALVRMRRAHPVAAVVEETAGQNGGRAPETDQPDDGANVSFKRNLWKNCLDISLRAPRERNGLPRAGRGDAMKDKARAGLARIVMANREHIIALEPLGKGIFGTRYDYEVRDEKNVFAEVPNPRVPKEMLELAEHILETKAGHFDPKNSRMIMSWSLRKLVKRKAAGERIEALPPAEDTGKVINLMEALRRSVQSGHVPGGRANRSSKKPARRSGHRHWKAA